MEGPGRGRQHRTRERVAVPRPRGGPGMQTCIEQGERLKEVEVVQVVHAGGMGKMVGAAGGEVALRLRGAAVCGVEYEGGVWGVLWPLPPCVGRGDRGCKPGCGGNLYHVTECCRPGKRRI